MNISEKEVEAALRFCETCEDGEGYDVPKHMMKRLAELGLVTYEHFGRYAGTALLDLLQHEHENGRWRAFNVLPASLSQTQHNALTWLAAADDDGVSSRALMFWVAFGIKPEKDSHPIDPDDFCRCLRLLHAAPDLRHRLPSVSTLSPQWARLAEQWDTIEAQFMEEAGLHWEKSGSAPKTYALMNEALRD